MSLGARIPWREGLAVAESISGRLRPIVERSKVAGSVRRRRPTVGDIEFVVEPRLAVADLFGNRAPAVAPVRALADELGRVTRGGDRMIQVTDLYGIEGLTLDLYLVHPPANWWCILAIRTGPADLGHQAVQLLRGRGLRHEGGRILRGDGSEYPVESEVDFFQAAGLPFLPPHLRDDPVALRPTAREP